MTSAARAVAAALDGRYTIERELGRGGMATVYLALDLKLHRQVALKVLRPELGAALGNERFLREIAIAARLSHPHILPLHDSGEAGGHLYYGMPYVEGESLRQRLEREGQLPIVEVIAIVRAVASALTYAHQHGVIHRDIKPENILLSANGPSSAPLHPLVADFGIARALDAAGGDRLTETGLALGTPAYMSPEQAASGRIDGRSDIYALGCVAYEMLAGQPPFTGPTAQAILARHAVDPVPRLHTVRGTVPPPVEQAIERALAKVPADRFSTADEFAQALSAKQHKSLLPRGANARRRLGLALSGVAVMAIIAVTTISLRQPAASLVITSASTIAVLPFSAPAADTLLTRLGRDLATTVSASLDGVGGIQTADRLRMAQELADRPADSPADMAALGRRLGARSILRGTLVHEGPNVRADLGLYDSESLGPLAQGIIVSAHHDSLSALTDSVVWALLRQVWQRGDPPSPSLASMTTRSLPALRAFLEGERELEKDRWIEAALAYRSAIAADSTFWLAYFRYALARYWKEEEVEPEVLHALQRHREVFSERDRLLVDAWSPAARDSLPLELELYREVTRRFPDYWPGWFLLGDRLYHAGPFVGNDWSDTHAALSRAVALNASLKPAWSHLFFNVAGKDTVESRRALAKLLELKRATPATNGPEGARSVNIGVRLIGAVAQAGGVLDSRGKVLADSMALFYASAQPDEFERSAWPWTLLWVGYPAAQVELNQRVLKLGVDPAIAAAQHRGLAWAWAERGNWDSALVHIGKAVKLEPDRRSDEGPTAVDEYSLAVLGVWLGVLDSAEASIRRAAAREAITGFRDEKLRRFYQGDLAWLDGLLAFALRDRKRIVRAGEDARRSGDPDASTIEQSLTAFEDALSGNRAAAARELARLEWICVNRRTCGSFRFSVPVQRLAAGTWLLAAGDTGQAARLLTWHEAAIGAWDWSFTYAVTPLAYLALARIEEAQGKIRPAREHYEQFLRRYDAPMPGQRHLVQEARAALARLSESNGAQTPR
jgi:tetratricopeptide (TPR) repeat protein/tRNA A-37 threonylcarbamoyl transferase component Bud32